MIITNEYGLDELIVKAVQSDYKYTEGRYSVTSILTDYRDIILKRRHNDEIVKDVSKMAWMMFGTAFHEYLEKQEVDFVEVTKETFDNFKDKVADYKIEFEGVANRDSIEHYFIKPKIKESHLSYKCERSNYTLTGYSDLYNILTNEVVDYKTASVNKVIFADWKDYRKQLLLYALMLNKMGFPCHRGRLIVFLKDWKEMDYIRNPRNYPPSPIYQIGWEFTEREIMAEKEWVEDYFILLQDIEPLPEKTIPTCSTEVRTFGKEPTYAIMKIGRKSAVRVFKGENCKEEAYAYYRLNRLDLDGKHMVVERPADDTRCKLYCDSCHWCKHYIENHAGAVLVDENDKVVAGFRDEKEVKYYQKYLQKYKEYKMKLIERNEEKEDVE